MILCITNATHLSFSHTISNTADSIISDTDNITDQSASDQRCIKLRLRGTRGDQLF